MNSTPLQCIAHLLASQFVKAYGEAERTGRQIEEVGRLDLLVAVARQVLSEVGREEDAALVPAGRVAAAAHTAPSWRVAADAHTVCEFARMAQMEIIDARETPYVHDVCDYVTQCTLRFEAIYRATVWGDDLDWTEATEAHWSAYTAANRPPWKDGVEDARRECEAEALRAELRRLGYNVTGLDGLVEIRDVETHAVTIALECHGDGTADIENHTMQTIEPHAAIATVLTYARLMKGGA